MLWVEVCVCMYTVFLLEVGSGVDESRDCVSSWSVPEVVRLDDLDTWSYPGRDMIGWCDFPICRRRSDDVASWPESQRDGLDDWFTYLAADLFYTLGMQCSVGVCVCACVCVFDPWKIKLAIKEQK